MVFCSLLPHQTHESSRLFAHFLTTESDVTLTFGSDTNLVTDLEMWFHELIQNIKEGTHLDVVVIYSHCGFMN